MGYQEYFNFIQTIYRFLTFAESPAQDTTSIIFQIINSIWGYRPVLTAEFTQIIVVGMLCFICYTVVNKIHATTPKQPSSYNNDININLWLNQIDDYLDVNKIKSDKQKQEAILQRIDKTNRIALRKLIDNKTIKSYQELQEHVKSLYNHDTQTTREHIINFVQRKQKSNETIGEFYASTVELAKKAFPKLNQKDLDQQVSNIFMNGLSNSLIRQQLLINHDKQNALDILTRAIKLQSDLGDSVNDYNSPTDINHINATNRKDNRNYSERDSNIKEEQHNNSSPRTNNSSQDYQNNTDRNNKYNRVNLNQNTNDQRRPICYNCRSEGHTARTCIQPKRRFDYRNYQHDQSNQQNEPSSQVLSRQTGNQRE